MPRNVIGIGNSIKGIFVKDYVCCDKGEVENALSEALRGKPDVSNVSGE